MYALVIAIQYKTSFFAGFSNRIYVSMVVNWVIVVIQSRMKHNTNKYGCIQNYRNLKQNETDIERKINHE